MEELRVWLNASGIDRGKIFRRVSKMGRLQGEGMTEKAVWHIVKNSAKRIGLEKLGRTTCAAPALGSATLREENWNRSSSFWTCFDSNDRTLLGLQAADSIGG